MQRTTNSKSIAPRGRSNLPANRRVAAPTNRNVSLNRTRAPVPAKKPVVEKKKEEPKVDTRTAEEIDASYRANVARFMNAKKNFDDAYERKVGELKAHFGVKEQKSNPKEDQKAEERKSTASSSEERK